jgi:hypothetical protein
MKITFICLANSKKHGERCIAGIELEKNSNNQWREIRNEDGKPKWIRPISSGENGQIEEKLVKDVHIFDVVEIDLIQRMPNGYQSENVLFNTTSLQIIESIKPQKTTLERLITTDNDCLFDNRGKAIPIEKIDRLQNSLCLISIQNPICRFDDIKYQFRLAFDYNGVNYDLPITDYKFLKSRVRKENEPIILNEQIYACVSVGIAHKDWHYKLVAGMIYEF